MFHFQPTIKYQEEEQLVKAGIDNLANFFLFLQTKPSFCRLFAWSEGWTFLPFLFSIFAVSLRRLPTYILFRFLTVAKWAVSSLTHSSYPIGVL
jgi:hypothetical protein